MCKSNLQCLHRCPKRHQLKSMFLAIRRPREEVRPMISSFLFHLPSVNLLTLPPKSCKCHSCGILTQDNNKIKTWISQVAKSSVVSTHAKNLARKKLEKGHLTPPSQTRGIKQVALVFISFL